MTEFVIDLITSADGYATDKNGDIGWFGDAGDLEETNPSQDAFLAGLEAILLGRKTYEMFSAFWPTVSSDEINAAGYINSLPKYVLSDALESAPWGDDQECMILKGSPADCARRIAQEHTGRVVIWGSLSVCRQFLRARLVDLLRIRTVPVLLGAGTPYADSKLVSVELTTLERFPGGNLVLEYTIPT